MNHSYKRDVVFKNDNVEVVEIEWRPGEASPVHLHGPCSGMVRVLEGSVYEVPYTKQRSSFIAGEKKYHHAGACFAEEALGAHMVGNDGDVVARTIHIYLPKACNEEVEL